MLLCTIGNHFINPSPICPMGFNWSFGTNVYFSRYEIILYCIYNRLGVFRAIKIWKFRDFSIFHFIQLIKNANQFEHSSQPKCLDR